MALTLDSGFRKFVTSPITESVGTYLRCLGVYGKTLGLESLLWRQSREAILEVKKGYTSDEQFLEICEERILQVDEPHNNHIRVIWTLRNKEQEHSFWLKLVLSKIPHFQGDLLSSTHGGGKDNESFAAHERNRLIAHGLAHTVFTKSDMFGEAAWLYVDLKIASSKKLRARLLDSTLSGNGWAEKVVEIAARELISSNAEPLLLQRKDIGIFLQRCDQQLMASLRADQFAALIAETGLSLSQWAALH